MHVFEMVKVRARLFFFSQIITAEPSLPDELSREASDFILKLLAKEPKERLGGGKGGAEELKRHPFFKVSGFPYHIFVIL
jgi:hypothetical protein